MPAQPSPQRTGASGAGDAAAEQERIASKDNQAQSGIFLSELQIDASPAARAAADGARDDAEFSGKLRVSVEVLGVQHSFGELTRRSKATVKDGAIVLDDLGQLEATDKPRRAHRASSFVVDFDEPSITRVVVDLPSSESRPTPARLEAFASRVIEHKTYVRSFDVASRVAETRSGDCTEHAVLAAALLRHFGYAARIVLGVVLVGVRQKGSPTRILAAGHAWVEYYENARWRVLDAALLVNDDDADAIGVPGLPEGVSVVKAYLPINVLEDESPSYARALMDEQGIEAVVRLRVEVTGPAGS